MTASIDVNDLANKVYKHNFIKSINYDRNIESLSIKEITDMDIDCILMSPPCQPFTRVGLKKDSNDNRCASLLHLLTIIPKLKKLKYILLENVKGFENSKARDDVISCIKLANFNYQEFLLSPCQFGIPNSRHRYYLLAKKNEFKFIFNKQNCNYELLTKIPENIAKVLPQKDFKFLPISSKTLNLDSKDGCFKIKYFLDENVDEKYLIPEKILVKRCNLLDVRTTESNGSCCFTKAYRHYVEGTGSVLSPYPDNEVKKSFEQFKNSQESYDEKIQILLNLKLRYFTPKEISRLMCFPENFEFPKDLTDKQKYRLIGNSINVYVVSKLIYLLNYENDLL